MAKVLFIQNCFVPDDNQFGRLKRSILSLLAYSTNLKEANSGNEYSYVLTGYVAPEYKKEIQDLVTLFTQGVKEEACFKEVRYCQFASNLGKGRSTNFGVNYFVEHAHDVDYLFMFDNDIVFEDQERDIVQILLEQKEEIDAINPNLKYPVISCNFKEHQVHNEGALDFGVKTKHGLIRTSTGNYGCIGGGCWLVEKKHWDAIGGYEIDAVYGKDDGHFYLATIKRKVVDVRHAVALSWDVYVIHPSDVDQTYNIFKADTNVNRVRKMSYDQLREDSNKFWKDRK